jgi:hypothetical protein
VISISICRYVTGLQVPPLSSCISGRLSPADLDKNSVRIHPHFSEHKVALFGGAFCAGGRRGRSPTNCVGRRLSFRQWYKLFESWIAQTRRRWAADPAEITILGLSNASSRADLRAVPWPSRNRTRGSGPLQRGVAAGEQLRVFMRRGRGESDGGLESGRLHIGSRVLTTLDFSRVWRQSKPGGSPRGPGSGHPLGTEWRESFVGLSRTRSLLRHLFSSLTMGRSGAFGIPG